MMKKIIINLLQNTLGFENYLYYFSRFKIFMLKRNKYEKGFLYFMDLIPEGSTMLDIGANIGITTIPLSKKFPKRTVHAFEPMPRNITALRRVIEHYKSQNIILHQVALGNTAGELKMVMPVISNIKMQGLSHVHREGDDTEWNSGEIFTVPVKVLDEIQALKTATKISAIKIDVENFEYEVLSGARKLLAKHKPVIYCELWDNEVRPLVIDYLKDLGYTVNVFKNNGLVSFTDQDESNFIFIPAA